MHNSCNHPWHRLINFIIYFDLALSLLSCSNDDNIQNEEKNNDSYLSIKEYLIAHRGLCNGVDAPENSRLALKRALAQNIYGTEFDVRQTKDGKIVICHDETFHGMIIEKSTYNELSTKLLSNGETIPLLEEFLEIRKNFNTSVKILVDVKKCSIVDMIQQISKFGLENDVVFISFTKNYCQKLEKLGFGGNTFYSNNSTTPDEIKKMGLVGVCYKSTFFEKSLYYYEAARALGIQIMVWTENDPLRIKDYSSKNIYVITDNLSDYN